MYHKFKADSKYGKHKGFCQVLFDKRCILLDGLSFSIFPGKKFFNSGLACYKICCLREFFFFWDGLVVNCFWLLSSDPSF